MLLLVKSVPGYVNNLAHTAIDECFHIGSRCADSYFTLIESRLRTGRCGGWGGGGDGVKSFKE